MLNMEEPPKINVGDFVTSEILTNSSFTKKIFLKGKNSENGEQAVLILEKNPFSAGDIPDILQEATDPNFLFKNDIYHSLIHFPKIEFSGIKTTLICPASDQIVKKYTPEPVLIINETEKLYIEVTEPYITEHHSAPPVWLYNVLDHKAEKDRILYEDPDPDSGFIILPDLKWDGITLESLYIQALPHNRKLRTIRDLTADHLLLLRKISEEGPRVIEEKYKLSRHQLLIYFHYLPSFYHIHVHFKLMQLEGNTGTGTERAHLLSTVIRNLELCPDYYKRATLACALKKSDDLLAKLLENENKISVDGSKTPA